MVDNRPIGLFDSGLGGLTVLKHLRTLLPAERFIYLGDTARTPWGTKSQETILRYARECTGFLRDREVKAVVAACNTASSVACGILREEFEIPIISMIEPAAAAAAVRTRGKRVGVIGTEATIASGAYTNALERIDREIQCFSRSCPLFVPLVEEGMCGGPIAEQLVAHYLGGLRGSGIDILILGCTHYPLLREALEQFLGPEIDLIDCGEVAAKEVVKQLRGGGISREIPRGADVRDDFFLTETPRNFERVAEVFLGTASIAAIKVHRL